MHLLNIVEGPNSAVECLTNLLVSILQSSFGEKNSLNKFQMKNERVSLNLEVVGVLVLTCKPQ